MMILRKFFGCSALAGLVLLLNGCGVPFVPFVNAPSETGVEVAGTTDDTAHGTCRSDGAATGGIDCDRIAYVAHDE